MSQTPDASLPTELQVAGAMMTTSAHLPSEMCGTVRGFSTKYASVSRNAGRYRSKKPGIFEARRARWDAKNRSAFADATRRTEWPSLTKRSQRSIWVGARVPPVATRRIFANAPRL